MGVPTLRLMIVDRDLAGSESEVNVVTALRSELDEFGAISVDSGMTVVDVGTASATVLVVASGIIVHDAQSDAESGTTASNESRKNFMGLRGGTGSRYSGNASRRAHHYFLGTAASHNGLDRQSKDRSFRFHKFRLALQRTHRMRAGGGCRAIRQMARGHLAD